MATQHVDAAVANFEQTARNLEHLSSLGEAATVSMAISLKRIADVLTGDPMNSGLIYMLDQIAVGVQS